MRQWQVAIDGDDTERLAAFWAEVLGYRLREPPSGFASWRDFNAAEGVPGEAWAMLVDPEGAGPTVLFHRVPEPKVVKNRVHLDVWVGERGGPRRNRRPLVDAEVERLVALGGSRLHTVDRADDDYFVVMQDPEGNEFCVA